MVKAGRAEEKIKRRPEGRERERGGGEAERRRRGKPFDVRAQVSRQKEKIKRGGGWDVGRRETNTTHEPPPCFFPCLIVLGKLIHWTVFLVHVHELEQWKPPLFSFLFFFFSKSKRKRVRISIR